MKYIANDKFSVRCGKHIVAKMFLTADAKNQLRIAQGMPREGTLQKLLTDCPEFCKDNGITIDTYPLLF